MRFLSACGLAMAAILSLAACGGNSGSQPTLGVDDIRELTGLSAPAESAAAQGARQQDIASRADSMVLSTEHVELAFPDETRTLLRLSECSGPECVLLNPVTGETVTSSVDRLVAPPGDVDAEAIGSAHGITLVSESAHDMGIDVSSFGAWMDHGSFVLFGARGAGEGFDFETLYTRSLGELTDRPPARVRHLARHHGGNARRRGGARRPAGRDGGAQLRHDRRRPRCRLQRHPEH